MGLASKGRLETENDGQHTLVIAKFNEGLAWLIDTLFPISLNQFPILLKKANSGSSRKGLSLKLSGSPRVE